MLKEKVKFLEEQKSFRFSPHRKSQLHNSIMPQGFFFRTPTLPAHDSPVQLVLTQHLLHLPGQAPGCAEGNR